jgi:hypothetical protein
METTAKIVEAYVRYMKRWATIPNIRHATLTISEVPVGYYRSGIELPPIIHLLPLWLLGKIWIVSSGSAPDIPDPQSASWLHQDGT